MNEIRKEIVALLQKYYINYKSNIWKDFYIQDNSQNNIYNDFIKIWKNEHGGYYTSQMLINCINKSESIMPKMIENVLILPEITSCNEEIKKRYIKICNNLILNYDNINKNLIINLKNNGGGKPEVMIAALLPLFNISKRKILTYFYDKNHIFRKDIIKDENQIICISNNNSANGTKRKIKNINKITIQFNEYTASSAEQTIIALFSLKSKLDIELIGNKSAGYTTVNKYFKLSDGGIEIPCGFMVDIDKNIYENGIK